MGKQSYLITEQDLLEIGFDEKSYTDSSIDGIESDFVQHINIDQMSYIRDKSWKKSSGREIHKTADTLINLLLSNELEAGEFKAKALNEVKRYKTTNKDDPITHFSAFAPPPVSTHSQKLDIINSELVKIDTSSISREISTSRKDIITSLLLLQDVIERLEKNDANYIELEAKQSKVNVDMTFIRNLFTNYKIFTGSSKGKYTTTHKGKDDGYYINETDDELIEGKFFNLVKLCLNKAGRDLKDNTIKKYIFNTLKP
jgi:hypothetical protein